MKESGGKNIATIAHKDMSNDETIAYGRGWLASHMEDAYTYTEKDAEGTPETKTMTDSEWEKLSSDEKAKWDSENKKKAWTGWAKGLVEGTDKFTETADTPGNTVEFTPIPYGYYLVTCGNEPTVSVNSATPEVTINDKNVKGPSNPNKTADKNKVAANDVVTYTVIQPVTNFIVQSSTAVPQQIKKYTIDDKSKGVILKRIVSVELYSDEACTESNRLAVIPVNDAEHPNPNGYSLTVINDASQSIHEWKMSIPWVSTTTTGEGESAITTYKSLYPSPAYIKLVYEDTVCTHLADSVSDGTATIPANVGKNTVTSHYVLVGSDNEVGDFQDTEYFYTTGISIAKRLTGTDDPLQEAYFKLYRIKEGTEGTTNVKEWYQFVDAVPATEEEKDPSSGEIITPAQDYQPAKINWVADKANATELKADNDFDTQEFKLLGEGTFYLVETKAPFGYVAPDETKPFKVELKITEYSPNPTGTYTDPADGKTVRNKTNVITEAKVDGKIMAGNDRNWATTVINNGKAPAMPQTGGKGTVALIAVGAILFIGTAVVLVSKKRMYNGE